MKAVKIIFIVLQIALGGLMVVGGVAKFGGEPPKKEASVKKSPEVIAKEAKMEGFVGGLIGTGYFWPFLGVVEIVGGLLLISQIFSLLGAFIILPVTVNIFLLHIFLENENPVELILPVLLLVINLAIIFRQYDKLKPVFIG
ncbi:MAG: hypothetical protein ACOVOW_14530 [Spirosomataceae bacterium]